MLVTGGLRLTEFTFVHAADLHLDSPLLGLAGKSAEYAVRVEAASREAFDNLVSLAIEEDCRFMLLAGDIFDGDLRNFQTGLYFMEGMRRLGEAGIAVFIVLGNHDSANRFADKLSLSGNVHVFPKTKATTYRLDDVGVAIHGRSFPARTSPKIWRANIRHQPRPCSILAFSIRPVRAAKVITPAMRPARPSNSRSWL
jgi:DNA repair exonuclease SbcCD nuclease subunit